MKGVTLQPPLQQQRRAIVAAPGSMQTRRKLVSRSGSEWIEVWKRTESQEFVYLEIFICCHVCQIYLVCQGLFVGLV